MKKCILITLALTVWHFQSYSQGIKFFEGSFEEAKAEAKKQNKYLFIDCWENGCAPCYKMEKEVLPLKSVGDFYNAHFVCLKMNMFIGEGIDIKKTYEIHAYPTCLYLDADGEVANFFEGAPKESKFIEQGKIALNDTNNMKG